MKSRSAPGATVVPVWIYEEVDQALDWLCARFGFSEGLRVARPGSSVSHAQLFLGECAIMPGRAGGPCAAPTPERVSQSVHVTGDDVDAHHERAKTLGARILLDVTVTSLPCDHLRSGVPPFTIMLETT